jgi:cyclophilin family peptidyl-prolyl cis-trans isomerase
MKKKDIQKLKITMRVIMVILILVLGFIIIHNKLNEDKMTTATIKTNKGNIKVELYTEKAPITTKNFIGLIEEGFYDGILFHRVEPNFVIQVGDPKTKTLKINDPRIGSGGSNKTIPLEVSPELKHDDAGVLSMARTNNPNSATSQFFITLNATPFLDMQYAVFGRVVEGIEVVKSIKVGDKIISVEMD